MANIFFKFLNQHIDNHDLDKFIDIEEVLKIFTIADKSVIDKLYKSYFTNEQPHEMDAQNMINMFGLIRTHNILCNSGYYDSTIFNTLYSKILSMKYNQSYRYYIKQGILLSTDNLEALSQYAEKIDQFRLSHIYFTKFIEYTDDHHYFRTIIKAKLFNTKVIRKMIKFTTYGIEKNIDGFIIYDPNIKTLKTMWKHFEESLYTHVEFKCKSSPTAIYASKKGLSFEYPKFAKFGLMIRKCEDRSSIYRFIEKILQMFASRNLLKLVMYYI